MNWGKGIVIGMAAFMGFILYMVITLMRHDVDLVSEDYYQQELNYEDQISAQTVYAHSAEKINMQLHGQELQFSLPELLAQDSIHLQLKRPDDKELDITLDLPAQQHIAVPVKQLKKGKYEVSVRGLRDQQPYLFQQVVIIP